MAERKYITDENLKRFGTNVKLAIKASETTLDGKITNVANIANNGVTAAAGALAEAKKKIARVPLQQSMVSHLRMVATLNLTSL